MFPRVRAVLVLAFAALLVIGLGTSYAEEPARDRVATALEVTDHRIQQAESVVESGDDARARLELGAAIDIQARARGSFGGSQFALSLKLTLESRGHADRAIALVRGLPDPDRVRAQIERSREMIDRARERVEECDRPRARSLMETALSMQVRSEDAVGAGRYLTALQLSMSARERALRALRLCNLEEDRSDAAERALLRTDQLLARAQDAVAVHPSDPARVAVERAQRIQEQARGEYRAERFEAALRLTQSARAFAHRAIRLASAGG